MSGENSVGKRVVNSVRFAASAAVGFPLAVLATTILFLSFATSKISDALTSHLQKRYFKTQIIHDRFFLDWEAWSWRAIGKVWKGFGLWAGIETLRHGTKRLDELAGNRDFNHVTNPLPGLNYDGFSAENEQDYPSESSPLLNPEAELLKKEIDKSRRLI